MSNGTINFKLDRSAFHARNASEQVNYGKKYRDLTWQERMRIYKYLNSIAYGYDLENLPRMDRSAFCIKYRK